MEDRSLSDVQRSADAAQSLLEELARIRGAALVALFDARGVCRALRRTPLICGYGSYRVLVDVSDCVPGKSTLSIEVDGRVVLARRLHDGSYAVVATSAAADVYETEVLLVEAAAGHALRTSDAEPPRVLPLASMTIPPPANVSASELPPLEASLVLQVGSLRDLYKDFEDEVDLDAGVAS